MPDLEMLLRDIRPVPEPAWAAKLDARVVARFPGPPPRWKAPLIALRDHMLALGAVATVASILILIVIAAPSFNAGDSDDGGNMATSKSAGGSSAAATPASEEAPVQRDSAGGENLRYS